MLLQALCMVGIAIVLVLYGCLLFIAISGIVETILMEVQRDISCDCPDCIVDCCCDTPAPSKECVAQTSTPTGAATRAPHTPTITGTMPSSVPTATPTTIPEQTPVRPTPTVTHAPPTKTPTIPSATKNPTATPRQTEPVECYQWLCHKPGTAAEQDYCCDSDGCVSAHLGHGNYLGKCR